MSLLDSLANAGKAAEAVQTAGKFIAAAAPLIEKAKELKASHPEIFQRIEKDVESFKTMHPAVSAAAKQAEQMLLQKLPELTAGCSSVAAGGSTAPLLGKLGEAESLIKQITGAK